MLKNIVPIATNFSSLNKDKYEDVNLYFQDEARFGMMNHLGKYLTACGVKPIVTYQHIFKTTYLYGSYSPINGDCFYLRLCCTGLVPFLCLIGL